MDHSNCKFSDQIYLQVFLKPLCERDRRRSLVGITPNAFVLRLCSFLFSRIDFFGRVCPLTVLLLDLLEIPDLSPFLICQTMNFLSSPKHLTVQ